MNIESIPFQHANHFADQQQSTCTRNVFCVCVVFRQFRFCFRLKLRKYVPLQLSDTIDFCKNVFYADVFFFRQWTRSDCLLCYDRIVVVEIHKTTTTKKTRNNFDNNESVANTREREVTINHPYFGYFRYFRLDFWEIYTKFASSEKQRRKRLKITSSISHKSPTTITISEILDWKYSVTWK